MVVIRYMKMLHRVNAALYYLSGLRILTNNLFCKALYNIVFGNNMKSTAFILA